MLRLLASRLDQLRTGSGAQTAYAEVGVIRQLLEVMQAFAPDDAAAGDAFEDLVARLEGSGP